MLPLALPRTLAAMPDFERRTTLALDADAAFELLAEPAKLPLWLIGVSLEESVAVDGDPDHQDEGEGEAGAAAPAASFVADRHSRRIEWAAPSGAYSATLEVQPMMAGMSAITVRLETGDPVDATAARAALDDMVKRLQRALTG